MIKTTRKCGFCRDEVVLEDGKSILIKGKYYHYDCFINKETNRKRGSLTLKEATELAKSNLEENREYIRDLVYKNKLFMWLQRKYDLVVIPTYVYQKIADIFNGSWKDLTTPIPPEDLYDMFLRQWKNLEKINIGNINKGKKMAPEARLNYDISIIINKSSSYYEWKRKQQEQQIEILQSLESSSPTSNFRSSMSVEEQTNTAKNDLSQYLEEI